MTDYKARFAAAKPTTQQRNDPYTPYQAKGSWYFDTPRKASIGPFVNEETCQARADYFQERDEE